MAPLDNYVRLTNDVLAVNYWGELLTVELLVGLLRRRPERGFCSLIVRQLMDETRHANVTRALLLERGRDPIRDDGVVEFTYHRLFDEWSKGSVEEVLVFLGTNERSSSRNFGSLIRVGAAAGDHQLVMAYSEILNDEVKHAAHIFRCVQDTPQTKALAIQANAAMEAAINLRYARLLESFPDAFGVVAASRAKLP